MSVDKNAIERDLQQSWDDLVSVVQSLPAEELEAPGVVEEWSVKDLLGHIAFWAEKAAADLRSLAAGRPDDIRTPDTEHILNEWNARESAARKGKSLAELRTEWEKSYQEALDELRKTDAGLLGTEVKGWAQLNRFLGDTTLHYKEHTEQIRSWQRQLETTEG